MKFFQIFLTIFSVAVLCFTALDGQSTKNAKTGILTGQILDCYGDIVKSAKIKIKNEKISRKQKSDKKGFFTFQLSEGIYEITIEKCGFKKTTIENVNLQESSEKIITVEMEFSLATDEINVCNPTGKICHTSNN